MSNVERVFIDTEGRDDDALRLGLAWLFDRARRSQRGGVIAVHGLANVERLPPVLPAPAARALARDKRLRLDDVELELMTARYQPRSYPLGPTLAIWANDQRLEQIEELQPIAVCAIPWSRNGLDDWKANFSPRELRSGARSTPTTVDNPVVAAALRSLTHMVNLSTGLGHPSDRAAAVTLFRILLQAGERYDPAAVRAFAVNNGWGQRDARELEEVARGVLAGRRFRVERFGWAEDILEQWRNEAHGR
jgi:hypothetical protein